MIDYINGKIKELNSTFNDYPVVLVEVFSANPELKGKMFAITEKTAGFLSIQDAIVKYNLVNDNTMSIGITVQCLNAMTEIENKGVEYYSINSTTSECYQQEKKLALNFIKENIPDANKPLIGVIPITQNLSYRSKIEPKQKEKNEQNYNQIDMPPAQFWGLLVLFLLFVFFIVGCFVSGW